MKTILSLHLRPLLTTIILAGSLALGGCVTPAAVPAPERASGTEDPLAIPERQAIGRVVLVDPEDEIALIEVSSSSTRTAPSLLTRNDAFAETARLEPTRFQRGRILGARIVSGLPNIGDEVFIAR